MIPYKNRPSVGLRLDPQNGGDWLVEGVSLIVICVSLYCPVLPFLKEYYEIVEKARPLSEFVPTHADVFTEIHF